MPLREAVYEDQKPKHWCRWPITVRLSGPGVPPALSAKGLDPYGALRPGLIDRRRQAARRRYRARVRAVLKATEGTTALKARIQTGGGPLPFRMAQKRAARPFLRIKREI